MVNYCIAVVAALMLVVGLAGCGKSDQQVERERIEREAALQKAIADSAAEEREKDRRMQESAAVEANERIAREEKEHEQELARTAAAKAEPSAEQQQAEDANTLRRYIDKLRQTTLDPASVQTRNAQLSPQRNGMCAEVNARDKTGRYMGFKRVVVTDARVTTEEPPNRDTLTQFLLFQLASRDTGCFPDTQQIKILQ